MGAAVSSSPHQVERGAFDLQFAPGPGRMTQERRRHERDGHRRHDARDRGHEVAPELFDGGGALLASRAIGDRRRGAGCSSFNDTGEPKLTQA